jgi:hypothetical protein
VVTDQGTSSVAQPSPRRCKCPAQFPKVSSAATTKEVDSDIAMCSPKRTTPFEFEPRQTVPGRNVDLNSEFLIDELDSFLIELSTDEQEQVNVASSESA